MTLQETTPRSAAGRRVGYVFGILANGVLLWLIHVWPGWDVVPFLTRDTPQVLGLVDASLVAGLLVNAAHLVRDPGWLTPAGTLVTTAFGLAATARVLQVFPFALAPGWATAARVLLVIAIVGSVVGVIVAFVSLLRMLGTRTAR